MMFLSNNVQHFQQHQSIKRQRWQNAMSWLRITTNDLILFVELKKILSEEILSDNGNGNDKMATVLKNNLDFSKYERNKFKI